ncbi:tripartite tricarboxylate transporter substrate binding protein [Pigmentiphaga soli]|uniref:Tripartite tricarboxylate transporter substrate binding protein n=1 Tax=Pigmentiphaga soli TaxID=1007095 RepID=A0ABP8H278_9BURK
MIDRRRFLGLPLAAAALPAAVRAADRFPSRPVRIVVPFPPGGLTDVSARRLAQMASETLGQPFVVENRPGANGLVGTAQAIRPPADGYTVVAVTTSVVLIGPLLNDAPFDPLRDLAYLLNYAGPSHALVVMADSPYRTFDDLIADARRRPGEVTYGTVGVADAAHFGVMALSQAKNVKFNHIPYQGASQSMMAAVSGEVAFTPTSNYAEMVKAGKLRVLALLDKDRLPAMPDVPTFSELGVGWEFPWITGFAMAAGTPEPIRRTLESTFLQAARSPAFGAYLDGLVVPRYVLDGAQMRADLAAKIPQYRKIAQDFGLKTSAAPARHARVAPAAKPPGQPAAIDTGRA